MTKVIVLVLLSFLFAFKAGNPKPANTYTFTEGQALLLYDAIQAIKPALQTSTIPAIQVTSINKALDSIQNIIAVQYSKYQAEVKAEAEKNKKPEKKN